MNIDENNLLAETDPLSESNLVRLDDWKLAHLRIALLHKLEETLSETLTQHDGVAVSGNCPSRKAGVDPEIDPVSASDVDHVSRHIRKPRPSERVYGVYGRHDGNEPALAMV